MDAINSNKCVRDDNHVLSFDWSRPFYHRMSLDAIIWSLICWIRMQTEKAVSDVRVVQVFRIRKNKKQRPFAMKIKASNMCAGAAMHIYCGVSIAHRFRSTVTFLLAGDPWKSMEQQAWGIGQRHSTKRRCNVRK